MKVLIIDDEEDTRRVAGMCLGMLGGLEVVEAASGLEGLRKAAEERPDVNGAPVLPPIPEHSCPT